VVDVAFALASRPELTQRYRGEVKDKTWHISATYPPVTHDALTSALDLAREAGGGPKKYRLRDQAEAEAVVALAARDPLLRGMKVERKGNTVRCDVDFSGDLPKVIFKHRFAGHWDVAGHDREAERLDLERSRRESQVRRAAAEAERRRMAPHDDVVLHRGKLGPYWRSDFARLDELEQETRAKLDAAFAGLGYRHVGDLVGKKRRNVLVRAYAAGDGLSYALLMAKRTMYLGYEFFSRFDDGSNLTTTTNAATDSDPGLKFYTKTCPGFEPPALHEKHLWAVGRFLSRKKARPVAMPATLDGVAREYDRALAQREGVGQRFRIVAPPPGEAPAEVRAAWVGCVLPLFATTDDEKVGRKAKGVVTGKKEKRPQGFTARVVDAIDALEEHNADAARWWRENTPDIIRPGKLFVFADRACQLLDDADD
jgi:hypothetical protein